MKKILPRHVRIYRSDTAHRPTPLSSFELRPPGSALKREVLLGSRTPHHMTPHLRSDLRFDYHLIITHITPNHMITLSDYFGNISRSPTPTHLRSPPVVSWFISFPFFLYMVTVDSLRPLVAYSEHLRRHLRHIFIHRSLSSYSSPYSSQFTFVSILPRTFSYALLLLRATPTPLPR